MLEWAREGEGRESDLNFLLDFLYKEIKRRERSQTFQKSKSTIPKKVIEQSQPSIAAFHTNSAVPGQGKHCSFCNKLGHRSEECFSLKGNTTQEIEYKIKEKKLCFNCLGHHFIKHCTSKQSRCKNCKGRHNSLLCPNFDRIKTDRSDPIRETQSAAPPPLNNVAYAHIKNRHKNTLMQVVRTNLKSPNGGVVEATVLFDGGSDRSFITESLVRGLQLQKSGEQYFAFSGFGGTGSGPRKKRKIISLELEGIALELTEIPIICADMFRAPVAEEITDSRSNLQKT
ncbi:tas retrotransposon peptidase a16 family protein [Plakobranchus ocellatus]|uniref:Tas retrotransposon peptidase a16 family protein n=1 Tax=Plakobranchus ocellatus TaxID=259542 RepID=A0AAV4CA57_9GAST|nr:tas retrotransposon peptidase a16 family protein [Plakobranchus ocellatus]